MTLANRPFITSSLELLVFIINKLAKLIIQIKDAERKTNKICSFYMGLVLLQGRSF
jgi:hypothetical protein